MVLSISESIYDDKSIAIVPITRCETIFHGDGHGIFRGTQKDITICVSAHLDDIKSQMPEVPSANSIAELALKEESKNCFQL